MEKDIFGKIKDMLDDLVNQVFENKSGQMNIKVDKDGTHVSWVGNKTGLIAAADGAIEAVMEGGNIDFDNAISVIKGYRATNIQTVIVNNNKEFSSMEEYEVYREMEKKSPEERDALKKQLDK